MFKTRKPTKEQRRASRSFYSLTTEDVKELVQAGFRVYDKRLGGVHVIPQRSVA